MGRRLKSARKLEERNGKGKDQGDKER